MKLLDRRACLAAALLLGGAVVDRAAAAFVDPLDQPARRVGTEARRPMMAAAAAGQRLVAVGLRGLIIVSDDGGRSWKQASVPVQTDLLAVHFPSASIGFAVGHDGVVLRTDDGGSSWAKQLDGRSAAEEFRRQYRAHADEPAAKAALQQIEQNFKAGSAPPWLDVWFDDAEHGYAVGSFGMLIATSDGGRSWNAWLDRVDHEQLNLNAIRDVAGELYIVGEQGRVHRLDRRQQRFVAVPTGYAGSFFGIAGSGDAALAFGLRGVAYRSADRGRSWERLPMPSEATIAAGVFDAEAGVFVLVNAAGEVLVGDAAARAFRIQAQRRTRLTGVIAVSGTALVTTGFGGVSLEPLPAHAK